MDLLKNLKVTGDRDLWLLTNVVGLTLSEVSVETGLSLPRLSSYRHGLRPTREQAAKLGDLIETVIEDLAAYVEDMAPSDPLREYYGAVLEVLEA